MGRILIAYKSPLGFYTDLITTNHRHLEDLIIDLKRMVSMIDSHNKVKFSDYSIYAVGEFDDEKGKLNAYDTEEFILQFPSVVETKEVIGKISKSYKSKKKKSTEVIKNG